MTSDYKMEQQDALKKVHYLSAQMCKRCFYNPDYGIVRTLDAFKNHDHYRLEPLVVVGVTHAEFPISKMRYFRQSDRISITAVLTDFWSKTFISIDDKSIEVQGVPDILVIDKKLKGLLTKGFFQWLSKVNVQYRFSEGKDRRFTSKIRQFQNFPDIFIRDDKETLSEIAHVTDETKEKYQLSLDQLNEKIFFSDYLHVDMYSPKMRSLLYEMYPKSADVSPFHAIPLKSDLVVEQSKLSAITSNDKTANDIIWHKACHITTEDEGRCRYGFAEINPDQWRDDEFTTQEDEDEDEIDTETETEIEIEKTDWRRIYNDELTALEQTLTGPSGRAINKWIVTCDGVAGEWWGDGYVIHTGFPAFITIWGKISIQASKMMSASFKINEKFAISVGFTEIIDGTHSIEDAVEFRGLEMEALGAVIEYLTAD